MSSAATDIAERSWMLHIGGASRAAAHGLTFDTRDPSTDSVLASVPDGDAADMAEAVATARSAAARWATLSVQARADVLQQFADVLAGSVEELALLDALDAGIPITAARSDVLHGIASFRTFVSWGMTLTGATLPASDSGLHFTLKRPFGVVGRIIPFNHPAMFAIAKIGAPLTAGNAVILKPSELTPLSALRIGELAKGVLPPGLLSVVTGRGAATGQSLVRHPDVRRIAFTGSRDTGLLVQRSAAEVCVKSVTLELGGKNAMLVFPDVDIERAAAAAVAGMNVRFAGQSCGSTSRLVVHESIHQEMVERVVDGLRALRVGTATRDDSDTGPVVSRRQYDGILAQIETAKREGASIRLGGGPCVDREGGYFIDWTVLDNVNPAMQVAQQEVFGPVLSILTFTDEDSAIALANSLNYGLAASVWTADLSRALRTARQMEAGYVWVNDSNRHYFGMPFGGVKDSGVGREESMEELVSYTTTQSFNVAV